MDADDIIEALEATAIGKKNGSGSNRTADRGDCLQWRNRLMLFIESLDGDVTVEQIRDALEGYHG